MLFIKYSMISKGNQGGNEHIQLETLEKNVYLIC